MGLPALLSVGLDGPGSEGAFTPGSLAGPSAASPRPLAWTVLGEELWSDWGAALGSGQGGVKGHVSSDVAGEGAAGRGSQPPAGFSLLLVSEA